MLLVSLLAAVGTSRTRAPNTDGLFTIPLTSNEAQEREREMLMSHRVGSGLFVLSRSALSACFWTKQLDTTTTTKTQQTRSEKRKRWIINHCTHTQVDIQRKLAQEETIKAQQNIATHLVAHICALALFACTHITNMKRSPVGVLLIKRFFCFSDSKMLRASSSMTCLRVCLLCVRVK